MAQPSSIGSIEPAYDAHNRRVRGFYDSVVISPDQVESVVGQSRRLADQTGATRISLRFVVNTPWPVAMYESGDERGLWLPSPDGLRLAGNETASIPLSGRRERVVYFGENDPTRIEPEAVRQKETGMVLESIRTARERNPFSKAHANGYSVDVERGVTRDPDVRRLFDLYSSVYRDYVFPLTEENVAALVQNPNSITAFVRGARDDIAAAAVAEVLEMYIDGEILRICEISDEATHPGYRGNGLNQACVQSLVDELMRGRDEISLVYAEDRATSRGVNQQSANLGWVFAGRLNKAGRINADRNIEIDGPYEDLNVWYYPLQK
ncbi:MAG: hypothetical protein HYS53_03420 [Candidatus Aenigmarchaeota archaeon]|nr:hypothetical protein [Candidatus Aenigmarchaeota archaeon]